MRFKFFDVYDVANFFHRKRNGSTYFKPISDVHVVVKKRFVALLYLLLLKQPRQILSSSVCMINDVYGEKIERDAI